MNIFKRKKNIVQIGPAVFIDANEIVAIYPEDDFLTIRFGGVGIMKVHHADLTDNFESTVEQILELL